MVAAKYTCVDKLFLLVKMHSELSFGLFVHEIIMRLKSDGFAILSELIVMHNVLAHVPSMSMSNSLDPPASIKKQHSEIRTIHSL